VKSSLADFKVKKLQATSTETASGMISAISRAGHRLKRLQAMVEETRKAAGGVRIARETLSTTDFSSAGVLSPCPTELRAAGTGICSQLNSGSADDFLSDCRESAIAQPCFEGVLYPAVFARMEGENRHATTRLQALREAPQEHVERAEFVIHGDAQGLEDTANRDLCILRR
jgi:hypothetical protein